MRGYGKEHREGRRALLYTLPQPCGYGCGTLLMPDGDWVAAHRVDGRPEYGWIASCRSCNEKAKRSRRKLRGAVESGRAHSLRNPGQPR
jgi:hypothetical protein